MLASNFFCKYKWWNIVVRVSLIRLDETISWHQVTQYRKERGRSWQYTYCFHQNRSYVHHSNNTFSIERLCKHSQWHGHPQQPCALPPFVTSRAQSVELFAKQTATGWPGAVNENRIIRQCVYIRSQNLNNMIQDPQQKWCVCCRMSSTEWYWFRILLQPRCDQYFSAHSPKLLRLW